MIFLLNLLGYAESNAQKVDSLYNGQRLRRRYVSVHLMASHDNSWPKTTAQLVQ